MDVEMSLQEYLDILKDSLNLPSKLSYSNIVHYLEKEIHFRNIILEKIQEKVKILNKYLKEDASLDYIQNIKLVELDNFKITYTLENIDKIDDNFFTDMVDMKIHYLFRYELTREWGLLLTLNQEKLRMIREG